MARVEKHVRKGTNKDGLTTRDRAMLERSGGNLASPSNAPDLDVPPRAPDIAVPPSPARRGGKWGRRVGVGGLVAAVAAAAIGVAASRDSGPADSDSSRNLDNTGQVRDGSTTSTSVPTKVTVEVPVLTPEQEEQAKVDKILRDGGFPEMVGRVPTFRHEVGTDRSVIHVVSFLSPDVLPADKFDKDAYGDTVDFMEDVAASGYTFTWNAEREEGEAAVARKLSPVESGQEKRVKYLFLTGKDHPVPQQLKDIQGEYSTLDTAIKGGRTYFWTAPGLNTSFARYADDQTFKYLMPLPDPSQSISADQQISGGLIAEAWVSSGRLDPRTINATESLKNTAAQVLMLAAYDQPISSMNRRFGNLISPESPRRYYPNDEVIRKIFADAVNRDIKPAVKQAA